MVVLGLASLLLVWRSAPASACTCALRARDPINRIAQAPYAFVGTARIDGVHVDYVARGDLTVGEVVHVDTGAAQSCDGTGLVMGEQQPILAIRHDGALHRMSCNAATTEEIRSYTGELPAPSGSGPIAAIVAARWGPATLIAIDGSGAPLRYGFGASPTQIVLCPGSGRFAAPRHDSDGQFIEVWDTATLTRLTTTPVKAETRVFRCVDAQGTLVIGEPFRDGTGAKPQLLRVAADQTTTTTDIEPLRAFDIAGDGSVVALETDGTTVRRRGRAPADLGALPEMSAGEATIEASADGHAALVSVHSTDPPRTYLVTGGATLTLDHADARFLDDGSVAVYRSADGVDRSMSRYDRSGALLETLPLPPDGWSLHPFGTRWLATIGVGDVRVDRPDQAFVEVGGAAGDAPFLPGAFRGTDLVQLPDPIMASTEPMNPSELGGAVGRSSAPTPDETRPNESNGSLLTGLGAAGALAVVVPVAVWLRRRRS